MYGCSRELVFHPVEPGVPRTDVSVSEFEVGGRSRQDEKLTKTRYKESSHGCI